MKRSLFTLLFLIFYCSLAHSVEIGATAPECPAMSAKNLNAAAFKGKVLLIDFWASWCAPCRQAMPFLNALHKAYLKDGFKVIGINVDENTEEAMALLKTVSVDYPSAYDPKGECPRAFSVKAMPSSYLVDKQGKIRLIHLGFRSEDKATLSKEISELLKE
jgi:thiol-disulfide isomerase/thioredoxin